MAQGGVLPEHRPGACALRHRRRRRGADPARAGHHAGANVQYVWPHPSKKFLYAVSSDGGPGHHPRHQAHRHRVPHRSRRRRAALRTAAPRGCRRGRCIAASTARANICSPPTIIRATSRSIASSRTARSADEVAAARKTRRRHLRPSGADHAGQPHRNHGDARQQRRRRTSPRTPARSRSMASRTACSAISPRSRAATASASARAISISIRPSRGCFSRSSARASCTSISSTTTARCRAEALFIKNALIDRANNVHTQMAGAIHVHPNGRFVTMTNRNSGTEEIGGRKVFKGGENNVAMFSIDPSTGEPTLIQNIEAHDQSSAHLRHRSERAAADRGLDPCRWRCATARPCRPRWCSIGSATTAGSRSPASTTSTPAASCSSGPASSRCRSGAIVASAGGHSPKHAWLPPNKSGGMP